LGLRKQAAVATTLKSLWGDIKWGYVLKPLWVVAAVLSFAILIASIPGYVMRTPIGNLVNYLVFKPTPTVLVIHHFNSLISFLSAALSLGLASLLFVKKSDQRMGRFLAFYLIAHGTLLAGPIEMLESYWPGITRLNSFVLLPIFAGPATAALIGLFPDGRFVPRWSGWLVPATLLVLPIGQWMERGGLPIGVSFFERLLIGMAILIAVAIFLAFMYIAVHRYRHISTTEQRQQTKWVVYGIFLWAVLLFISTVPWMMGLSLPPGSQVPWWLPVAQLFWYLSTAILPLTLTIAVMRYRLFEVDLFINRTLVYGPLTAGIILLYIVVVGAFGLLFQSGGNLIVSLMATGLVAVLFQPLRERLQRGVNHMMYGDRDDPVTIFTRLGDLLEASGSPQEMLPGLVRTIAQTLKLPYTAIELGQSPRLETVAEYGQRPKEIKRFPLVYQSEHIGNLLAAPRDRGENFGGGDQQLLENIARQAGAMAYAVHLANELQRSRTRLVKAREEERRRLRRDLHDELGPQLASQALIIEALEKRLSQDPASAARLLGELKRQSQQAVEDIRQIVYDLRPPALDDLGLVDALLESLSAYQRSGVVFRLLASEKLPPLPAAIEAAAYRIIQEAVTNVVRHSGADSCLVRIEYVDGPDDLALRLLVEDDGNGLPSQGHKGVGLHSMRERAVELGGECIINDIPEGGVRVQASLPLVQ
jgi:signal transduction histidine kinase